MSIHFVNATGEGFIVGSFSPNLDGSVMVRVGASIEREEESAREEEVELFVRIRDARDMTLQRIETAALDRAIAVVEAAQEALTVEREKRGSHAE